MNERNRLRGIGRYWPLALLLGAVVGAVLVVTLASSSSDGRTELSVGRFISEAQAGQVTSAVVDGDTVEFELRGDPGEYETKLEDGDTTREVLVDAGLTPAELEGMDLRVEKNSTQGRLVNLLITFLPVVFVVGILFFFIRQANRQYERPPMQMMMLNYDPVCKRSINPGSAGGSSNFMDTTYYFCSSEHKQQFDADPVSFLLQK